MLDEDNYHDNQMVDASFFYKDRWTNINKKFVLIFLCTMSRVRCCTDLDKTVLTQNFDKRGWTTVSPDEDWNFYWFVCWRVSSRKLNDLNLKTILTVQGFSDNGSSNFQSIQWSSSIDR